MSTIQILQALADAHEHAADQIRCKGALGVAVILAHELQEESLRKAIKLLEQAKPNLKGWLSEEITKTALEPYEMAGFLDSILEKGSLANTAFELGREYERAK